MRASRRNELLAAVFARPLDDAPREAFARALTEDGDARGWFVAAQLLEAAGRLPVDELERLIAREERTPSTWLGALQSQVIAPLPA